LEFAINSDISGFCLASRRRTTASEYHF